MNHNCTLKFPFQPVLRVSGWFFLLFFSVLVRAQPADAAGMFAWLREQKDIPTLTVEADLKKMEKARAEEPWFDARLTINGGEAMPVRVKVRGKMRRKTCDLPPIKIRFAGAEVPDSIAEFSEIKAVLPCFPTPEHEKLVARELLCYQLYQVVTDQSFAVAPVKLRLFQTGKAKPAQERSAFLIEPVEALALRMQGRPYAPQSASIKRLDSTAVDRMALFQYMIGNTDWSVPTRHNVKLVVQEKGLPLPVPYDFDYSGLVNAPYASPQQGAPTRTVTERWFMGLCRTKEFMTPTAQLFLDKKTALLSCVEQAHWLLEEDKNQIAQYLQGFFNVLENPKRFEQQILEQCRKD